MSTRAKMSLADIALQLRDEQLQARIVHYKADLETSPELDAVTASVVAELQALQKAAGAHAPSAPPEARPDVRRDRAHLEPEADARAPVPRRQAHRASSQRKIAEASKRFARLFFESELCEKIRGSADEQKTMRFGSRRSTSSSRATTTRSCATSRGSSTSRPTSWRTPKARLEDITKELRNEFLSGTTPELNALVKWPERGARELLHRGASPGHRRARVGGREGGAPADARARAGYKIGAEAFPRFRASFERKFLQRLVAFVEDGMLARVREKGSEFRAETMRFVADPQIFTDVCELVCDAVYDFLYNDGFLDLPSDWRARLGRTD